MEEENKPDNHHSIVQFEGRRILFCHRWSVDETSDRKKRRRRICAEYLQFDDDGTIQPVIRTTVGVAPLPGPDGTPEREHAVARE